MHWPVSEAKSDSIFAAFEVLVPERGTMCFHWAGDPENGRFKLDAMLEYLTLILACQLIGEFAVSTANIPFPGPVAGMILLFGFLLIRGEIPEALGQVSGALLNNLSLMFVPAGVGVMVHLELLGSDALPLSIALVVSTLLTIAITALVMLWLSRILSADTDDKG